MTGSKSTADRFERTREAHRAELAEDYVEVVLDLIEDTGEARVTEIAAKLGVAHPTVAKALRKLEREGLVELVPYRPVRLTSAGLNLARECRERHRIVVRFLLVLGLDAESAELEAEGIEHHVSEKTLLLMSRFGEKPTAS
ncbi:MAG: manganese-binding transcriptional regulator MntR [Fimbriimonadaceae bacterium]|nr:manganese-binding transcriptional regulator MntR [Fimbriimonadaceae bacterium]QYK56720.1 MAG: manganese-binding transcriptional regulator MntR [Fimbriimonadaceae bacterium]